MNPVAPVTNAVGPPPPMRLESGHKREERPVEDTSQSTETRVEQPPAKVRDEAILAMVEDSAEQFSSLLFEGDRRDAPSADAIGRNVDTYA